MEKGAAMEQVGHYLVVCVGVPRVGHPLSV